MRGVTAAATASGSISRWSGSTSTNTGHRSDAGDRLRRRDERVHGDNDLAAAFHTDRPQRQFQRVGAVRNADAVPDPGEGGVVTLEGLDFFSADKAGRGEKPPPLRQHLVGDLGLLRHQVDERDTHDLVTASCRAGTPAHVSPVGRSAVSTAPMPSTAFLPTRSPSRTLEFMPR